MDDQVFQFLMGLLGVLLLVIGFCVGWILNNIVKRLNSHSAMLNEHGEQILKTKIEIENEKKMIERAFNEINKGINYLKKGHVSQERKLRTLLNN